MLVLVGGEIDSQTVREESNFADKEPDTASPALGEPIPHSLTLARHGWSGDSRKKSRDSRGKLAETRPISAQKCVGNSRSMKRNRRLLRKILDLAQRLPTLRPASWSSVTRPHALGSSGNRPPTSGDPGESRARPKMGRPADGGLPSTVCAGAALRSVRPGATQDRSGLEHLCARGPLPVDRDRVRRRRGAKRKPRRASCAWRHPASHRKAGRLPSQGRCPSSSRSTRLEDGRPEARARVSARARVAPLSRM